MKIDSNTRILCVGSFYGPSNAWRRKERFKALGFNVSEMNTSNLGIVEWEIVRKIIVRFAKPLFIRILENALLQKVKENQPQVIFLEKSQWLRPKTIQKLRSIGPEGMILAHYNPDEFFHADNPNKWGYFLEAIPFYDVHFVPKALNIADYEKCGGRNIYVYDRSYDPSFHRPIELSEEEAKIYGCVVGFIGKYAPHREKVIAELIQTGRQVAVWGNGWWRGENWEVIKPFWRGPALYGDDYVKAICGMQIALHFLRKENLDEQDSRSFELPACAACMIAERSPAHERLFTEGEEALYFDTTEELIKLLDAYSSNLAHCREIGRNARNRCETSPYSHDERLTEFLQFIQTTFVTEK